MARGERTIKDNAYMNITVLNVVGYLYTALSLPALWLLLDVIALCCRRIPLIQPFGCFTYFCYTKLHIAVLFYVFLPPNGKNQLIVTVDFYKVMSRTQHSSVKNKLFSNLNKLCSR